MVVVHVIGMVNDLYSHLYGYISLCSAMRWTTLSASTVYLPVFFFERGCEESRMLDCFRTIFCKDFEDFAKKNQKRFWGVFDCFGPISTKTDQNVWLCEAFPAEEESDFRAEGYNVHSET